MLARAFRTHTAIVITVSAGEVPVANVSASAAWAGSVISDATRMSRPETVCRRNQLF